MMNADDSLEETPIDQELAEVIPDQVEKEPVKEKPVSARLILTKGQVKKYRMSLTILKKYFLHKR